MSNSNYNLSLTAEVTYKGQSFTFTFDPYNDCTDLDGLRDLAESELETTDEIEVEADGRDNEQMTVKIIDFEDIPEKWANDTDCWEFAQAFAECSYDIEVVEAGLECGVNPADIDEAYSGEFTDDEDFAQDMADQLGAVDKDAKWPMNCIDWEFAAKELMYDYCSENGHYFRNL